MDIQVPNWLNVSRETLQTLQAFADEVARWNGAINLVSKASLADLWQRHIWDSAQLYDLGAGQGGVWLDMGSGGGFPGIVMAIMGAQGVVLAEVDQRKATFLREVSRKLALDTRVISARLDEIPPCHAQTITARALAPLTDLLAHASKHLSPTGRAIFPKGRGFQAEIDAALKDWAFSYTSVPSKTDAEAAIIIVHNIAKR